VEFSHTLGRLSRAIASDESNRSGRVDELAAQYASGSYSVDPAAIGHGIITDALVGAH
jgi:anti-sigma28 factor (negative regulator of flagellin synthesis)